MMFIENISKKYDSSPISHLSQYKLTTMISR